MTERPAPRTVVLVRADAPRLPFVASALGIPLTAVSRDGWSAVVLPPGVDAAAVAAAGDPSRIAVEVFSDGAQRRLRVHPPVTALDAHRDWGSQLAELARDTTITWSGDEPEPTGAVDHDATDPGATDLRVAARSVASIASLCDLDPAATARLENYARTPSSALLLESVLQLLGLPVIAAKIVEGQRELDEVTGVAVYEPRRAGLSLLDSASVEPSGADVLSRIQRAYVRRPALLLALGGVELALGTGLAALAARGGRGSRALGSASALMFSDAALQTALWASVRGRKKR